MKLNQGSSIQQVPQRRLVRQRFDVRPLIVGGHQQRLVRLRAQRRHAGACSFALACACLAAAAGAEPQLSPASSAAEAGLIDIAALVPDAIVDMRYAGGNNFVGQRIDGYHAPRCYLLKPAALALQRVAEALREKRLRLRIFDCYRPARAVRHFVEWAADPYPCASGREPIRRGFGDRWRVSCNRLTQRAPRPVSAIMAPPRGGSGPSRSR